MVGALLLLLICALCLPTYATEKDALAGARDEAREGLLSLLPDAAKGTLSDPTDADAVKEAVGFSALFSLFASS